MLNGPATAVSAQDGRLTVSGPVSTGGITGLALSSTGKAVANATVIIKNSAGYRATTVTDAAGRFTFNGLTIGGAYTLNVSALLKFRPQAVTVVEGLTEITLIAEP